MYYKHMLTAVDVTYLILLPVAVYATSNKENGNYEENNNWNNHQQNYKGGVVCFVRGKRGRRGRRERGRGRGRGGGGGGGGGGEGEGEKERGKP